jgi:hypothetical protein
MNPCEDAVMSPGTRAALFLLAFVLAVATAGLAVWLLLPENAAPRGPAVAPIAPAIRRQRREEEVEPEAPPKTPFISCEELAKNAKALDAHRGEEVIIAGPATWLDSTTNNQRLLWGVEVGRDFAGLGDDGNGRPVVLCIFRGARPAGIIKGNGCRIRGTFNGHKTNHGTPLLDNCDLE